MPNADAPDSPVLVRPATSKKRGSAPTYFTGVVVSTWPIRNESFLYPHALSTRFSTLPEFDNPARTTNNTVHQEHFPGNTRRLLPVAKAIQLGC